MRAEAKRILVGPRAVTQSEFEGLEHEMRVLVGKARNVLAYGLDVVHLDALVVACRELKCLLVVAPDRFGDGWRDEIVAELPIDLVLTREPAGVVANAGPGGADLEPGLGVFTSGTTGRPKLALHDWNAVQYTAAFVKGELEGRCWFMAYSPVSYAGFQVFFSALNSGGCIVYPEETMPEACEAIVRNGVEVISATPSYWRALITAWPRGLKMPSLLQATMGGEIVTQDVIDLVKRSFKPRKLTHIYASTEAGSAIVVSDGEEGFPSAWLNRQHETGLRVRDSVLEIRSKAGMRRYVNAPTAHDDEGWYRTPDIVTIDGHRVRFVGRSDGIINVGGIKISPEQIEHAINRVPGVTDSHVYARSNPITGSLVVADVLLTEREQYTVAELRAELKARLPESQLPNMIQFVDEIEVSESGKKQRS